MHTKTFDTINAATDIYVRELRSLRKALAAQLAMVDDHLAVCVDFADSAVALPREPEPAKDEAPKEDAPKEKPAQDGETQVLNIGDDAKEPKDLLLLKNWDKDQASGRPMVAKQLADLQARTSGAQKAAADQLAKELGLDPATGT